MKPVWLAPAILLLLVVLIFSLFLPITDIGLYDETSYLQAGVTFFEALPEIESGPLYSFWYWLGSFIVRDNFDLYFASWCALTALCLVLPYVLERSRAAVIYAVLACMIPFYIVWPYINLFSSAIILASLSFIETRHEKSYIKLCAVLLLTCSVVSLVRPEFHYASYFSATFLIGAIVLEKHICRHLALLIVAAIAFVAVEALFSIQPGNRSGVAFAAYHDWIAFAQGRLRESPRTPWNAYDVFGLPESATLLDFMKANPAEFWSHIFYAVTRPKSIGLLMLGLVTAVATSISLSTPGRFTIRISLYRLIPLAIVYIPAVAAVAIIIPKSHYLIIPYLVSMYYLARSDIAALILGSKKAIAILVVLACASIVTSFAIKRSRPTEFRIVDAIKCTVELQTARGIYSGAVLEALGGLSTYLKGHTVWVRHYEINSGESFGDFIARTLPTIIVSDQELHDYMLKKGNFPNAGSREEFNSFIRGRGYENFKCATQALDVFYIKNGSKRGGD